MTDCSNSSCLHERYDGPSSDDQSIHEQHWRKKRSDSTGGGGKRHKHRTTYEINQCDRDSLDNSPRKRCNDSDKFEKNIALNKSRCLSLASSAFWPVWVFQMYDSNSLAQRASDLW